MKIKGWLFWILCLLGAAAFSPTGGGSAGIGNCPPSPREEETASKEEKPWQGPVSDPLHLPSHVLPLGDGSVLVLDGANCRMAFFRDGRFVGYAGRGGSGPGKLQSPYGLCAGPSGKVVVADTGNTRLQIFDGEGALIRVVPLDGIIPAPRPSGVACDPVAGRLYVTDTRNNGVHIFTMHPCTLVKTVILEVGPGERPALPCHPVWWRDSLFVVEPLNGRIRRIGPEGEPLGFIGRFGCGRGALYRPKGVAVDFKGRVYVTDSLAGKLSVFTLSGAYLGELCRESATRHGWRIPHGLAFDRDGSLWVVEMGRHGVVRLEDTEPRPGGMAGSADSRNGRSRETGGTVKGPECTTCHPEWLPEGGGVLCATLDGHGPPAGRPGMCLGCHDGSLADSRGLVFRAHSHGAGRVLSVKQRVFRKLPAGPGGEMTCMTCHAAHGEGGDDFHLQVSIFIRTPGPREGTCTACHENLGAGRGSHFMGPMGRPVPERLVRTGAAPSRGVEGRITCRTCHVPHGEADSALLAGGSTGPCRDCHADAGHPGEPHAAVEAFTCRECHPSHRAARPGLLATRPGGAARTCGECHKEQTSVEDTVHDLKSDREACGFCHASYGGDKARPYLWRLEPGTGGFPSEHRCRSCHRPSGSVAADPVPRAAHPGGRTPQGPVTCVTCHDPHTGRPSFLREGVAESLCASCHGPEGLWLFLYFHQEDRSR